MEENLRISFLKKIWYSIARPSKYEELKKLGLGKAIKYVFSIISILTLIVAIISTFIQINIANDTIAYLENNLPNFTFKDNKLTLEDNKVIILDDERLLSFLGNKIVINTLIKKEQAIDQYKDLVSEKNNVLVFLNEEYVLITYNYNIENNNEEGIDTKKYSEISSKYINSTNYEYTKKDVVEYLKMKTTYTYYLTKNFIVYSGTIILLYFLYIIIIASIIFLIAKISILKWTYNESIINTIYASTLSIIIYNLYIVQNIFTKFRISLIDMINICLIFIYLYFLIRKQKKYKKKKYYNK